VTHKVGVPLPGWSYGPGCFYTLAADCLCPLHRWPCSLMTTTTPTQTKV